MILQRRNRAIPHFFKPDLCCDLVKAGEERGCQVDIAQLSVRNDTLFFPATDLRLRSSAEAWRRAGFAAAKFQTTTRVRCGSDHIRLQQHAWRGISRARGSCRSEQPGWTRTAHLSRPWRSLLILMLDAAAVRR